MSQNLKIDFHKFIIRVNQVLGSIHHFYYKPMQLQALMEAESSHHITCSRSWSRSHFTCIHVLRIFLITFQFPY